jgi:hypothetical protein
LPETQGPLLTETHGPLIMISYCRASSAGRRGAWGSLDHFVGACEQRWRNGEAQGLRCNQVHRQIKLGWLLDWKIAWSQSFFFSARPLVEQCQGQIYLNRLRKVFDLFSYPSHSDIAKLFACDSAR